MILWRESSKRQKEKEKIPNKRAAEPGRAADTAGAVRGLGAIHPPKRFGLLVTRQRATSRRWRYPNAPRAPGVGRTRIAWQLPRAAVLHASDARQRRS